MKTGGYPQDISDSSGPELVTVRIAEMLQELRIQQLANLRELTILVSLQVLLITDLCLRALSISQRLLLRVDLGRWPARARFLSGASARLSNFAHSAPGCVRASSSAQALKQSSVFRSFQSIRHRRERQLI